MLIVFAGVGRAPVGAYNERHWLGQELKGSVRKQHMGIGKMDALLLHGLRGSACVPGVETLRQQVTIAMVVEASPFVLNGSPSSNF